MHHEMRGSDEVWDGTRFIAATSFMHRMNGIAMNSLRYPDRACCVRIHISFASFVYPEALDGSDHV